MKKSIIAVDTLMHISENQYQLLMNKFVEYIIENNLEVDNFIDEVDPENQGKVEPNAVLQRFTKLGINMDDEEQRIFQQKMGNKTQDGLLISIDRFFDEINRRFYAECPKFIKTMVF